MMSRYDKQVNSGYSWLLISVFIILLLLACWLYWSAAKENDTESRIIDIPKEPAVAVSTIEPIVDREEEKSTEGLDLQYQEVQVEQRPVLREKITLPTLEQSDEFFRQQVATVSFKLSDWFGVSSAIKKYLVIVNDLSQNQLLFKHRLFLKAPGKIVVGEDKLGLYLSKDSYHRYDSLADAMVSIDVDKGLQLYLTVKPLLEQVYKDFAYPEGYQLQDVFLKAAASVIKAPVIDGRIALLPYSVRYKFADHKLETLTDVEKLMIRMGPENTLKIQNKLRQLVQALLVMPE